MKYEFIESDSSYFLVRNGHVFKAYGKAWYSKVEAETAESEVVMKSIKAGKKVEYEGLICC